ncbi:MAG TPA: aminotransferase class V-fold PLP-dependent enzyme [Acidimicrobiia bacterium]
MSPAIDLVRARADTPGCAHVVHLNNAGASLTPQPVLETVIDHLRLEARIGAYEAAEQTVDAITAAGASIARLVGASPHEIAYAESATRAWDHVFYSLPLGPGDRILTHRAEYASNYMAMLQVANRTGARIEIVPSEETGEIDVTALTAMLDDRVALVAITHVPTSSGLVNPAAAVGAALAGTGIPYLLDACQSVGQLPIDVAAIGCDFLATTGRKFLRAPRGTGFLYVAADWIERLQPGVIDLRSAEWTSAGTYELRPDARRFEQFERSYACYLGLGAAADYALTFGLDAISERVGALAESLRERLRARTGVTVLDQGREQCGIVTFAIDGHDPDAIRALAAARHINVWATPASMARLDFGPRGIESAVRASVHYFNTDAELDQLCAALPPATHRPT